MFLFIYIIILLVNVFVGTFFLKQIHTTISKKIKLVVGSSWIQNVGKHNYHCHTDPTNRSRVNTLTQQNRTTVFEGVCCGNVNWPLYSKERCTYENVSYLICFFNITEVLQTQLSHLKTLSAFREWLFASGWGMNQEPWWLDLGKNCHFTLLRGHAA